ncbi:MAG TPA: alkaline phosphatase family protein [Labilithrix sp.]|nr:alkaline phosphatase family protein [Labilithrix sp.]
MGTRPNGPRAAALALSAVALALLVSVPACGSAGDAPGGPDDGGGDGGAEGSRPDGGDCPAGQALCGGSCIDVSFDDANCGACANVCKKAQHCGRGTCQESKIQHVVLIVMENHSFDAYFGRYCQAPAGSDPTCTEGPACCERAPDKEPRGALPVLLDDASNFAADRDHAQACELQQINKGKMDGFVTGSTGAATCFGSGPDCANPANWALADATTMAPYWKLAGDNALADRYHQPIAGGTASNNMYFATTHYQFTDNDKLPDTIGTPKGCLQGTCVDGALTTYRGRRTVADVLIEGGKTFAMYVDGYAHAKAGGRACESVPDDCPYTTLSHPVAAQACKVDASDLPFLYYEQFADGSHTRDYGALHTDLASGKLPSFSFVKPREFRSEHPNVSKISDGMTFVQNTVTDIANSPYADSTLVLLTWDEGGGFFDHVPPPPPIDLDDDGNPVPYGTRVPLLAIGKFARHGSVSHVRMEHSSVVRFLEWNFTGPVGQLGGNDGQVHNIGSLLDPELTVVRTPED